MTIKPEERILIALGVHRDAMPIAAVKDFQAIADDLRRPAPKPVDPLVEAIKDCELATLDAIENYVAKKLRAAMKARGYQWAKIGEGA